MKKVLFLLLLISQLTLAQKWSDFAPATSINATDFSALVQSGLNKKYTFATLRGFLDTAYVRIATKQYIKGKKVFQDSTTFTKNVYMNGLLDFTSIGQAKMPLTLYNGGGSFAFDSSLNRVLFKDKNLLTDTIATYKQNNSFVGLNKFVKSLSLVDTSLVYANIYTAVSGVDIKGVNSYVYTSSNPTANQIFAGYFNALGSGTSGGSKSYGIYSTASGSNDNYAGYFDAGSVYIKNDLFTSNAKFNIDTSGNIKKWANKLIDNIPTTDSTKVLYSNGKWKTVSTSGSSIDTTKISYLAKNETYTGNKTFNGIVTFGASSYLYLPVADPTGSPGYFWRSTNVLKYTNSAGDAKTLATGVGTANEIPYWVDANTLGSLAVASYPSLTELSYVKGVTSAIQTQFTGKLSTSLTNTYLYVGNGSNIATGVAMSGDATIANTGAVTVANDSHDHTGSTISGLAVADFTSPNISNWTNDAGYLIASTGVTLGTNQTITGGKSFASYLNFTSTGTLSLPTLATTTKGDIWYKEDGTYTVGEYRGYNVNGAFSLIRDNGTYINPAWLSSLAETKITFTDVTTGNASTSNHGYLPKLNNSATQFLNGQGAWATPTATIDQTAAYSWTGLHKWTSALLSSDTTGAYFNSYTATSGADIKGLTSYVYTSSNPTANKIYGGFFSALGSGTSGGSYSYGIYSVATGSNTNIAGYFNAPSGYAGYFDNGLVYIKDNLQVGSAKFIISTTGTLLKVNDLLASDYTNRFIMSDGTSYTPTDLFGRDNVWTGSIAFTPESFSYNTTLDASSKTSISAGGSGNGTTTTISNGVSGQILILINTSSSFTWTLNETGNINLAGSADYVMGQSDTITLIYESGSAKWLETARSNN